jgi:hypothetical protein
MFTNAQNRPIIHVLETWHLFYDGKYFFCDDLWKLNLLTITILFFIEADMVAVQLRFASDSYTGLIRRLKDNASGIKQCRRLS